MMERASLFFESGRDCGCQKVGHFNIIDRYSTYHGGIVGTRKELKERLPTEEISHIKNRQRGSCERVRGGSSLPMVRETGINLGIEPSFYSRLPFIVSFHPSVALFGVRLHWTQYAAAFSTSVKYVLDIAVWEGSEIFGPA
jgi:hypothetical protein